MLISSGTAPAPAVMAFQGLIDGYTAFSCTNSNQCSGLRKCYDPFAGELFIDTDGILTLVCMCMPSNFILEEYKGGDCGDGGMCSNEVEASGRESEGLCGSRKVGEAIAESMGVKIKENGVCVSVKHLQHLSSEELEIRPASVGEGAMR